MAPMEAYPAQAIEVVWVDKTPSPAARAAWSRLWSILLTETSRPRLVDDPGSAGEHHQGIQTTEAPGAAFPEASQDLDGGLTDQAAATASDASRTEEHR